MATKRTADEAALDASSSSAAAAGATTTATGAYSGYTGYAGADPAAAAAAAAAYYAAAAAYPTTYGYGAYGTYGTAAGYYGSAAGSAAATGVGVGAYRMPVGPVMPLVPQKTVFDAPEVEPKKDEIDKKCVRAAAGDVWVDKTLAEWDENDFRLFVGDLGPDCTDEVLRRAFEKYPSFQKAKVVMDKRTGKSRGFGFVSFKDPHDFSRALKEMNGKYVGSRPVKLRKSTWKDRQLDNRNKEEIAHMRELKKSKISGK